MEPSYPGAECDMCHQNYRCFYRTLNNNLVLLCPERNAAWIQPDAHEDVCFRTLRRHFGVPDEENLFEEANGAGWATQKEVVQDRKWRAALDRTGRINPGS